MTPERYVDARELAHVLGVSVATVKRWTSAGAPSETWGMRVRAGRGRAAAGLALRRRVRQARRGRRDRGARRSRRAEASAGRVARHAAFGAGDAFAGALLVALGSGEPLSRALELACEAGSRVAASSPPDLSGLRPWDTRIRRADQRDGEEENRCDVRQEEPGDQKARNREE